MAEKTNFKPLIIGIGIAIGLCILFRARISIIEYKDVKIPVFRFIADKNSYFFEWALGTYTLETEYGDIIIKPFCDVIAVGNRLVRIPSTEFKKKRASHNLHVLENPLDPVIGISFSQWGAYKTESILIRYSQEFSLNNYAFHISDIFFKKDPNDQRLSEICIFFVPNNSKVNLSDHSEIEFLDIYDKNKDYGKMSYNLTVVNDNTWYISVGSTKYDNYYFMVKKPGWSEARKCYGILFESNWGKYIDSKEFVEESTSISVTDEIQRLINKYRL